ncbi:MAG: translesion error-prone DNA polymerase V autoproteolytic subunit [Pseudomonadota bacterium]|nr:translesion error-prone DNA polymerase V autoproteolytic subunit [Pseudomonadota bacterium]
MPTVVALLKDFRPGGRDQPAGNASVVRGTAVRASRIAIQIFESPRAQAGFPSPAADYVEERIDLNELLIRNPPATFCVRIGGDSLVDIGLLDGDIVTVDRSLEPRPGKIVVAAFDGDIYIKVLRKVSGRLALCSENQKQAASYPPMFLDQAQEHSIWGVVTGVVRTL